MRLKNRLHCNTLGYKMGTTLKAMVKKMNNHFCEQGLPISLEQMYLLLLLDAEEELIQQDIADITGKDKSAVFRQIHSLEEKHLVARMESKEDKRKKILMLTKAGIEMIAQAKVLEAEVIDEITGNIDPHKMDVFENVLNKIYVNTREE